MAVKTTVNIPLDSSTTDRTHARTGPDTQRAQSHNHTQYSNTRTQPRHTSRSHAQTHTQTSRHTPSATATRERTRQGNHRLSDLHRPLRQRLRPLPPLLPLVLHLCRSRPTSSSWSRRVRPANCDWRYRCRAISRLPLEKYACFLVQRLEFLGRWHRCLKSCEGWRGVCVRVL